MVVGSSVFLSGFVLWEHCPGFDTRRPMGIDLPLFRRATQAIAFGAILESPDILERWWALGGFVVMFVFAFSVQHILRRGASIPGCIAAEDGTAFLASGDWVANGLLFGTLPSYHQPWGYLSMLD